MVAVQALFFVAAFILLLIIARRQTHLLLPVLATTVALEISRTWFPNFGKISQELGTVDLTRLTTLIIIVSGIAYVLQNKRRSRFNAILASSLNRPILLYVCLGLMSTMYSIGHAKTAIEVLRLLLLWALMLAVGMLYKPGVEELVFKAVFFTGGILSFLAYYEAVTKHFLWRGELAEGMTVRVNTTFVDPNIFARYLVLAVISSLVLQVMTQRRWERLVYGGGMFILLGALAVTLSRSGMVTLVVTLALISVLYPHKRILQTVGIVVLGCLGILVFRPAVLHRVLTFKKGLGALDEQRQYLWRAAAAIFLQHPLTGVGLGGFQKAFIAGWTKKQNIPSNLLPYFIAWKETPGAATLAHNTVLTIASELGILGLSSLAWFWVSLTKIFLKLRSRIRSMEPVVLGLYLWIVAVFVSSLSEARFFEDPIVWLSIGMLVGIILDKGEAGYGL